MKLKRISVALLGMLLAYLVVAQAGAETPPYQSGRFPQEVAASFGPAEGLPSGEVLRIELDANGNVWAETDRGWAVYAGQQWSPAKPPAGKFSPPPPVRDSLARLDAATIHQATVTDEGQVIVAADAGLLRQDGERFVPLVVEDGLGRRWGVADVRGVAVDSLGQLWFATLAGAACQTAEGWKFFTGQEGLSYNDFTTVEAGPEGVVWFGTRLGAIRFDGEQWDYRQGPRWLPDDEIRDIAVDADGNAWFATAAGVGLIERRMMTLGEKADFYEDEMEKYIRRTPFGYVSEVTLEKPGDKSKIIYHDSDNDGLWTAMYGAGECFAYAATGDAKAKDRAQRAFEALRFLQKVPEGSKHSPPRGYVARTIRSTSLPDPNEGRIELDRRQRAENDQLWKVYEPRWPKSADGKWYWKSDTSSDELDGHYFFYPLYYDLVADSEAEKQRVREVVKDLTDHLINHGFNLVDHDGTPTRWGYYAPESMNYDPHWWAERGLKSLSMLSYLAVAEHVTGDPVYGEHFERLVDKHAYGTNAMIYKIHRGPGSGNHSDDEMAFMCYYNLLKYGKDPALERQMLLSFFSAWANEQPEMNPFFNFAYAAHGLGAEHEDQWGTHSLSPWEGWLEDSMATLHGLPLDRLNWPMKNSHRLDVVPLPRQSATVDITDEDWPATGRHISGKVIPVENRHFNHWNTNPWRLDYGGNGQQLASGTVFLLPYYMGLYHDFIEE